MYHAMLLLSTFLLLLSCLPSAAFYQCDFRSSDCCNGLENLCDTSVTDVVMGMVHNSMSSADQGFIIGANHREDAYPDALDAGYRALSIDICNCNGNLELCHGSATVGCGIGDRDPVEVFSIINAWLDEHKNDVIVIYLEINEEAGGPISLDDVDQVLQAVSPMDDSFRSKLYVHTAGGAWPTLRQLIASGSQVLFFYIRGPNGMGVHPDGIHHFFDFAMENDFAYASIAQLEDTTINQNCPIDRGASSTKDFFLMNNFVTDTFPVQSAAATTNTASFAKITFEACEQAHSKRPNFISVDFWHDGNIIELVQILNGGSDTPDVTSPPTDGLPDMPTEAPTSGIGRPFQSWVWCMSSMAAMVALLQLLSG